MKQNIEVGYAFSNRVKCHFQNIIKDDIRIGHVLTRQPGLSFEKKLWYHLNSLYSIKIDRNQDLDILNIHGLKEEDQKKVRKKVDQIRKFYKCCFKGLKGSEIFAKTGKLLELCKNLKRLTINSKKKQCQQAMFF
ncbi:unnamed protein product [Paramecium pentaurelia]|uniref:PARP-type domain-containing protein n=1 Tax=Paramecium pentaurelia TaxID=43138 RepID=A0A8S1TX11_9CILI|nr:unnamed protein product [Paramecium pentaurelia]